MWPAQIKDSYIFYGRAYGLSIDSAVPFYPYTRVDTQRVSKVLNGKKRRTLPIVNYFYHFRYEIVINWQPSLLIVLQREAPFWSMYISMCTGKAAFGLGCIALIIRIVNWSFQQQQQQKKLNSLNLHSPFLNLIQIKTFFFPIILVWLK